MLYYTVFARELKPRAMYIIYDGPSDGILAGNQNKKRRAKTDLKNKTRFVI